MKKVYFFTLSLFWVASGFSQQIITPFGGYIESENSSLSFTTGELVVPTLINDKAAATQGFQQPNIIIIETLNLAYNNGIIIDAANENGVFHITGVEEYPDNQLIILNRWGEVVYQVQPYQNEWKGYHNNQALPQATYYFIFYTDATRQQVVKGNIYLLQP